VDECEPLVVGSLDGFNVTFTDFEDDHGISRYSWQGLTLVHFPAQPEPFLSLQLYETTQRIPQEVLTSSRSVDKCTPLTAGSCARTPATRRRCSAMRPNT